MGIQDQGLPNLTKWKYFKLACLRTLSMMQSITRESSCKPYITFSYALNFITMCGSCNVIDDKSSRFEIIEALLILCQIQSILCKSSRKSYLSCLYPLNFLTMLESDKCDRYSIRNYRSPLSL